MAATQTFKHMFPNDIPPFATYIWTPEGQSYTSWEFDVILGNPHDPGALYPANKRAQSLYLGALKVDAVGWLFHTPTLIECKPDADLGAIGQIFGYSYWFRRTFGVAPRKMIVCESMRDQVQEAAAEAEIEIRICPPGNALVIDAAIAYVRPLIRPSPLGPNPLEIPR